MTPEELEIKEVEDLVKQMNVIGTPVPEGVIDIQINRRRLVYEVIFIENKGCFNVYPQVFKMYTVEEYLNLLGNE